MNVTGFVPNIDDYHEKGYLIVGKALSQHVVESLCNEALQICLEKRGEIAGAEELGQLDAESLLRKIIAIHFPHKLSDVLGEMLAHPIIIDTLTQIIGPNVKCMQSMFFVKHAGRPGQAWHQDEKFIPTRDRSLTGVWIALDKASVENGCLWVVPGSHKRGVIWPTRVHASTEFDHTEESFGYPYAEAEAIPVELEPGSILFFDGYLLHKSNKNVTESGSRRSYVCHYMNADSMLPWSGGTLAYPVEDYRDIVLVAGEDPYAFKGTEDISIPYLRPES
jgi:phytanoyl-CoA hydroxylase